MVNFPFPEYSPNNFRLADRHEKRVRGINPWTTQSWANSANHKTNKIPIVILPSGSNNLSTCQLYLQVSDFVADFLDGVGDDDDAHAGQVGRSNLEDPGREDLSVSVDLEKIRLTCSAVFLLF